MRLLLNTLRVVINYTSMPCGTKSAQDFLNNCREWFYLPVQVFPVFLSGTTPHTHTHAPPQALTHEHKHTHTHLEVRGGGQVGPSAKVHHRPHSVNRDHGLLGKSRDDLNLQQQFGGRDSEGVSW